MVKLAARFAVGLASLGAVALLTASPAAAVVTIGSNLAHAANGPSGLCGFSGITEVDRSCTEAQESLEPAFLTPGGLVAPSAGVIVRWRVRSGPASASTAAVKLRLRLLHQNSMGAEAGGASETEFVSLPLAEPGVHVFPARLPVAAGDQIGVDSLSSNTSMGPAEPPIVYVESGIGTPATWTPSLLPGETRAPNGFPTSSMEVLLNADIEPDADRDGYGDETQDGCPSDPTRHGPCAAPDRTPPQISLTYKSRQDFPRKRSVIVNLSSNESATASANGQLEIFKKRRAIVGLSGATATISPASKLALRIGITKTARRAAGRALAHGHRVAVRVSVSAKDAAGNQSSAAVAVIKPPRR